MPDVTILSWNVKDLNEAQVNDSHFILMMALVIKQEKAHLVSILETKSNKGADLGNKLGTKLGPHWRSHSSSKSAPYSNKPENYVFLWDSKVITSAGNFKFPDAQSPLIGFPNQHNTPAKKKPSRFPYLGDFGAGGSSFTCVVFHTTFASVDIAEANQNLAKIDEVKNNANVIIMGDFNDDPAPNKSRTYKGKTSFEDLLKTLKFDYHITVKTSLCQAFLPSWSTSLDCRASVYDNFFLKSSGDLTRKSADVVDLVDALKHPGYLAAPGKALFNSWATRANAKNAKKKNGFMNTLFTATENIATLEDAHEVHWVAVSDHLPICLRLSVK